jgi:hypothetical protein
MVIMFAALVAGLQIAGIAVPPPRLRPERTASQ